MTDEGSIDVSGGSQPAASATPPSAPAPSAGTQDATPVTQPDGSTAAPESQLQIPETDDDLRGKETQPYARGLLELRNGYRELNNRYQELQSHYEPVAQQLEHIGGINTAAASVDLVSKLFTPQVDQLGQPMVDQYTGLPITSTSDFVQTIASDNWDTALDLTENLLSLPTASGEPLLAEVCRRVLGIDPGKLDLYRQISSSADAARMGLLDIDPIELQDLPEQYHQTYARLNPMQREAVQDPNIADVTRQQMLEQYAQQHRWQDYQQSQEAELAQQQQQREMYYAQQVESHGEQTANALWNTHAGALEAELGKIQWSADPTKSQKVNQVILGGIATWVQEDPRISPMYVQAYELIKQASRFEAMGNRMQANQARVRAAGLSQQIAGHARILLTEVIGELQGSRGMASTNGANGNARMMVSGTGRNGPDGGRQQGWQAPAGIKFGSKEYFDSLFEQTGR